MKYRAKIQRELRKNISLQELSENGEIHAQAQLINHRERTEKLVAAAM